MSIFQPRSAHIGTPILLDRCHKFTLSSSETPFTEYDNFSNCRYISVTHRFRQHNPMHSSDPHGAGLSFFLKLPSVSFSAWFQVRINHAVKDPPRYCSFGMQAVNSLHDSFSPLNTRLNYLVGDRRSVVWLSDLRHPAWPTPPKM